jgi:hypothetical protein
MTGDGTFQGEPKRRALKQQRAAQALKVKRSTFPLNREGLLRWPRDRSGFRSRKTQVLGGLCRHRYSDAKPPLSMVVLAKRFGGGPIK